MVRFRQLNRAEVLRPDFAKSLKLLAEVCAAESFSSFSKVNEINDLPAEVLLNCVRYI